MKINIGGGLKRYEGFLNIDHDSLTNPDFIVDLEKDTLPFEDSTIEEIKAHHILEHIGEGFFHLMKELYRVCKPGAIIDIAAPHHRHENYYGDPTHRRPITVEMFKQFSKKYCDWHQEFHGSSTGFAARLGVDFEVAHSEYSIEKEYVHLGKEGRDEELMELAKRFNNVFIDVFYKTFGDKRLMQNQYQTTKEEQPKGIDDLEPFVLGLSNMGERDLAIKCVDVFAKNSAGFGQYDNLSKCYFKLKLYDKAIKYGEAALVNSPTPYHAYVTRFNLINLYNHANYPEKALVYISINEKINSNVDLDLERAYALYLSDRKTEAQKILENTLATRKDLSEEIITKINFNLGTYYLYEDKFQQGLRHFILDGAKMKLWNTETIFSRNEKLNLPFWQGSADCKNLIVYAEAGIGDELINIRFMKLLKEKGINAIWYEATQSEFAKNDRPGIVDLFRKNGINVITRLEDGLDLPNVMWTYSMHLPIYMNLEYKDLWYGPYLQPCDEFKNKWKSIIKNTSNKKIGIRWKGSRFYDQDLHRSYPIKQLYSIVKNSESEFYNLQKDEGHEDLEDFPSAIDHSSKFESIEDTFALISNLDLVITSCTSVAHMAASQGKRTMIFVPISAYYVWSHSGKQSPWYGDHVTLLRQKKPRVWDEPMAELKEILEKEKYL